MSKLHVYRWQSFRPEAPGHHHQTEEICAAPSKVAVKLLAPRAPFNLSITQNAESVRVATAEPGVVFWRALDSRPGEPFHRDPPKGPLMTKTKLPPRLQYEIRFNDGRWELTAPDKEVVNFMSNKHALTEWAACELDEVWNKLRVRSELTIFLKNGNTIQDRRTYGDDPKRTKG